MKKYCLFILTLMVVSIGDSLCFKANIGVSPYEALALTFNYMSHIKIGTLTLFVNACMILFQVILSKQLKVKYVLQFFMSLFFGMIVNTIVYQLLGGITLHYYQSLIMEIIGLCISASGCGLLVALNVCVFPCEGFALTFSNTFKVDFQKTRQVIDIILVISCISLSLIFQCGFALREGTIIAACIFSPIMGFVQRSVTKRLILQKG
ncbi:YczE/YyaS/YitT family protein [Faecalibacillus faecis]|uniref:YczE/YyaS/YitT family protein n=1 Tax=Faecalibacillus faecis TaxID=1982628 RepID=UPI0018AC6500|nr:hypothetical protein [Faecalibacillus faecis]